MHARGFGEQVSQECRFQIASLSVHLDGWVAVARNAGLAPGQALQSQAPRSPGVQTKSPTPTSVTVTILYDYTIVMHSASYRCQESCGRFRAVAAFKNGCVRLLACKRLDNDLS